MNRFYLGYGVIVLVLFIYFSVTGMSLFGSIQSGKWTPQGRSAFHK